MIRIRPFASPKGVRICFCRNFFTKEVEAKRHFERRMMKFTTEELFDVVSDVSKYSEFVPWCKRSTILKSDNTKMSAELKVGFGLFSEKYVSDVVMQRPNFVNASSKQTNLFEYLTTEWTFTPANDPATTWVTFQVDFKFKSQIYNEASDVFKKEVVNKMVQAFEDRARHQRQQRLIAAKF